MSSERCSTGTLSALIVDDNWFNRDIVRIALESIGFSIAQAESGAEGLEILKHQTYDLLILDLQMPVVDGHSVLKAIHLNPIHKAMELIIVTANPQMVTPDIADMSSYVMYKPISVMEFSKFVKRIFRLPSP